MGTIEPKHYPTVWDSTIINNLKHTIMIQTELRKVKEGDSFRLKDNESAPLWVRGYYERSERKFEVYKYDNVNHENFMRGNRAVYVEC